MFRTVHRTVARPGQDLDEVLAFVVQQIWHFGAREPKDLSWCDNLYHTVITVDPPIDTGVVNVRRVVTTHCPGAVMVDDCNTEHGTARVNEKINTTHQRQTQRTEQIHNQGNFRENAHLSILMKFFFLE